MPNRPFKPPRKKCPSARDFIDDEASEESIQGSDDGEDTEELEDHVLDQLLQQFSSLNSSLSSGPLSTLIGLAPQLQSLMSTLITLFNRFLDQESSAKISPSTKKSGTNSSAME